MKLEFPKGFLWGSSTSAHQVEGNNHNDWTEWENANADRLADEALKKKFPDYILNSKPSPFDPKNYISGKACDHYNKFREDFDIAKSLGQNAHRFSIEWSRIEPQEGKWDEREIEHYRDVIRALRERGLEPFVTLWHWTNPIWIKDIGGWENPKTVDYFVRYVNKISRSLENIDIKFWMPINEPGTYTGLGYIQGIQPPGIKSLSRANNAYKNLIVGFIGASDIIHKNIKNSQVGVSHFMTYFMPYRNFFWNFPFVWLFDYISNWRFLNPIQNKIDFIGIQYYWPEFINVKLGGQWGIIERKHLQNWLSDTGFAIYPEGMYHALKKIWEKYNKPIYITENGVADAKDIHREKFIQEHLLWTRKALSEGVDVRGYFYWSFLDNYEMPRTSGFWPRFGLVEINYKTLERKIRPSALKYKEIIQNSK